jgi:hypothetical protein
MDWRFWRSSRSDDVRAWNVMVAATDPDRCWQLASTFRDTKAPGSVLTCEMSFLMGSIVRDAIRAAMPADRHRAAILSAESAYFKTFDDQSDEELPKEMQAVYGNIRLGHVARMALAAYGDHNDSLLLTLGVFVQRIKGDPRMKYEIMPVLEESRRSAIKALKQ